MSLQARRVPSWVAHCVAMLLLCAGAQAQKIKVEYDKSLDFSQFKTYAWGHHDAVSRPILALEIAGTIEEEFTKRGLKKVDENPDIYVEMYGAVDSDLSVTYFNPLYGGTGVIPPFDNTFVMWGYLPGGTTSVQVHKGQLVVDVLSAKQKKLIWRGQATDKLSDQKKKLQSQVHQAVDKMFKQYPVKPKS
jgi:hypothetical protein